MKQFFSCLTALMVVIAFTAQSSGQIILVDEDFSTDAGIVTGGNGGLAGLFSASGGVGTLSGNSTDTFLSIGVNNVSIPELALGGMLTFQVDNLGGVANPVTRWLQVDVDGVNVFSGRQFGSTDDAELLNHADDGGTNIGTTTIPAGTTELDLLFVTTVDFGGTALPNGEIARLGSFYAEFTAVPEPTSGALLLLGATCFVRRRRR